jgi:hypothetical protein
MAQKVISAKLVKDDCIDDFYSVVIDNNGVIERKEVSPDGLTKEPLFIRLVLEPLFFEVSV